MKTSITLRTMIFLLAALAFMSCEKPSENERIRPAYDDTAPTVVSHSVSSSQWLSDISEGTLKYKSPEFTICALDDEITELTSYFSTVQVSNSLPYSCAVNGGTFTVVYSAVSLQYRAVFYFIPSSGTIGAPSQTITFKTMVSR